MKNEKSMEFKVNLVGLEGEAPKFAAYKLDSTGRLTDKLNVFDGKSLKVSLSDVELIAFGPDAEDFKTLPRKSLAIYRVQEYIDLWRKQGIVLPLDVWKRFHFHFVCVTGKISKCRPWYWEIFEDIRHKPFFDLAQVARIKPITADLHPHIHFPFRCLPMCDGIIEIYERECCCYRILIPELIIRLRDLLKVIPIPIPDPIPHPIPGPDPGPFAPQLQRVTARAIKLRKTNPDLSGIPSRELYEDYLALRSMTAEAAQLYVLDRPYLFPFFCNCTVRKVGQTSIQPGGKFSFCYLDFHHHLPTKYCHILYAYKVKQLINGVLTVVYDGLAAHQYFAAGTPANIHSYNPKAIVCADGPGEPPPNDGDNVPFIMLEHVGGYGTFHFNFPQQTGVSQVGALGLNHGTYTTTYAPDCPWGGGLALRLWFSPELEPIVKYYRLKVFAVNDTGSPIGSQTVLDSSVTWDKLISVPGDLIRVSENLGPVSVGAENNLFKVPYWSSPDHRYLSGQFHQVWNTVQTLFPDGKYMLILEVFDAGGNRVKPNGSTGPGTGKNFQFRRWTSAIDTDAVPFADLAHVFWIDNTPVVGDIADFRENGIVNNAECQFMTGTENSTFAIGFRAFHLHGVEHAGNGDDNSFMWHYGITWHRGLNGDSGQLNAAPSGGTNHTDVGETGDAVSSGTETFKNMLTRTSNGTVLSKCTFSVVLQVYAKHFNGQGRIQNYDDYETASFALEIIS